VARASSRKRGNPKDNKRRGKKKISLLSSERIDYVDYKDVDLLKRFLSDRAKIRGRRVNGNDVQQQRVVSKAIKNAREMGLLPYTSRVTTQRRGRSDRGDSPRRSRDDNMPFEETESPAPVAAEAETAVVESDAAVVEGAET
jgi:small subunit ribosomal protein S18